MDGEAALKKRFEFLSQNGNVECSTKFEASIATMAPNGKLQGSCCAPMDEARYRQQIEGLREYSEIAEVPPDPYDISAPLAHRLMGYYDLALNKEEQSAYDYAMQHSDMQGPCCCKCWRWKVYGGLGQIPYRPRPGWHQGKRRTRQGRNSHHALIPFASQRTPYSDQFW